MAAPDHVLSWTSAVRNGLIAGDPAYYYDRDGYQADVDHALIVSIQEAHGIDWRTDGAETPPVVEPPPVEPPVEPPVDPTVDVWVDPSMSPDTIQNVIDQAGTGASIGFREGIYNGAEITPLDSQSFINEGAVTLDGQDTARHAFSGAALHVTIRGFEITRYDNPPQIGVVTGMDPNDWYVNPYQGPGGWTVEDCDVHHNAGAGITLGYDDAAIRRCKTNYNRQIGFKLLWGRNQSCVDTETSFNNYLKDYDWGWEGGGSKNWESVDLLLARNYSHHNHGPGLWSDHGNTNTRYVDNIVEDNYASGIFHEISEGCVVEGNQIRRNGLEQHPWLWGAGVQIANGGFAVVRNNLLEDNGNGVCFTEQGRGYGPLSGEVYNNQMLRSGITGVASDQPEEAEGPFDFYGNTYEDSRFAFGGSEISSDVWLGYFPNDG